MVLPREPAAEQQAQRPERATAAPVAAVQERTGSPLLEPKSDLSAGVQSEGIVTFGPSDPNQPLELQFEWYSEDYNNTASPIVFQITP